MQIWIKIHSNYMRIFLHFILNQTNMQNSYAEHIKMEMDCIGMVWYRMVWNGIV